MKQPIATILAMFVLVTGCASRKPASTPESLAKPKDLSDVRPNIVGDPAKRGPLEAKFAELRRRVLEGQKQGSDLACSKQIMEETRALLHDTYDFPLIDRRLQDLERSLTVKDQSPARNQRAEDGAWGACYQGWYWKVVESVEQIRTLHREGKVPAYPCHFLDRINRPEKLTAYLNSLLLSDVRKDGVDRRRELNEAGTSLMKLILRKLPRNYPYHPDLRKTFLNFVDNKWQNQDTGYWGAWYLTREGVKKSDDLSITFHIVSYREGQVAHLEKIVATTLKIKDLPYPLGWRDSAGNMSNHHNYDVVRLLRYGWRYLENPDREASRKEIRAMLKWALEESLLPDGTFKFNHSDDSLSDSDYFGVSFLTEVGYFDRQKRFWTDQDYPEAEALKQKILTRLLAHETPDLMTREAIAKLQGKD